MRKYLLAGALFAGVLTAAAQIPSGYYDALEGKSGVALKKAVKSAASKHTAISYGSATWGVFIESDTHYVGNQLCWWDMYSPNNVPATSASAPNGMNIEHSVANSWWGGDKNDAYKDLMHLNPSNSDANSRKSNYPLGEIATETWSNGVTFVGKPKSGTCGGATYVYEPADEYKGDFARVFFYMFTIYDNISWRTSSGYGYMYDVASDLLLKPWAYEMLLRWSREDPVSQKEIDRNNVIYKHQKNRNPFIDCPDLAEHIWGTKSGTPYHFDGSTSPDDPDTPTPGPDDPVVDPSPTPAGYWYAVTSAADLNASDSYVLVSTESNVAMAYAASSSSIANYLQPCSKNPTRDTSVSPARLKDVPDDVAVLRLTKNGSGWLISLGNKKGETAGYLKSEEAKKVTLTQNAADKGTTALISPSSAKTEIKFGTVSATLQYNNQENGKRFTTYTSSQEPVMLYRLEAENGGNAGIGTGLIDTGEEVILGIYDLNGRKMQARDFSELERGIYIVVSNFGTKKICK